MPRNSVSIDFSDFAVIIPSFEQIQRRPVKCPDQQTLLGFIKVFCQFSSVGMAGPPQPMRCRDRIEPERRVGRGAGQWRGWSRAGRMGAGR